MSGMFGASQQQAFFRGVAQNHLNEEEDNTTFARLCSELVSVGGEDHAITMWDKDLDKEVIKKALERTTFIKGHWLIKRAQDLGVVKALVNVTSLPSAQNEFVDMLRSVGVIYGTDAFLHTVLQLQGRSVDFTRLTSEACNQVAENYNWVRTRCCLGQEYCKCFSFHTKETEDGMGIVFVGDNKLIPIYHKMPPLESVPLPQAKKIKHER
jgi:hypothetical protein